MGNIQGAILLHSDCITKFFVSAQEVKRWPIQQRCKHMSNCIQLDIIFKSNLISNKDTRIFALFCILCFNFVDMLWPQFDDFQLLDVAEIYLIEFRHRILGDIDHLKGFLIGQMTLNQPFHINLMEKVLLHLGEPGKSQILNCLALVYQIVHAILYHFSKKIGVSIDWFRSQHIGESVLELLLFILEKLLIWHKVLDVLEDDLKEVLVRVIVGKQIEFQLNESTQLRRSGLSEQLNIH